MELKNFFVQDLAGNALPDAIARVYLANTTTLAGGLEDKDGNPQGNPIQASAIGQLAFAAPDGDYDLFIYSALRNYSMRVQFFDTAPSANESALAGLAGAANKGLYFTGLGAMALYDLSALGRTLGGIANEAAGRAALAAAASGANTDITSISGSAASLTTSRSISATGDATWTVSFNGTADATAVITLTNSGVGAGTYGSVTVNAKGLVTSASTTTPIANGGTGQTTAGAALTALGGAPVASPTFTGTPAAPTPAVGTNTTQLATAAMIQTEIANKRAWTSFTPTITLGSGTYTSASATGTYMVAFGICFVRMQLTVTTKGTGANPELSLPFAALAGHVNDLLDAREVQVVGTAGLARIHSGLAKVLIGAYNTADLVTADGCVVVVTGSYPIA